MTRCATSMLVAVAMMIGALIVVARPAHAAVPADILATYHDVDGRVIYYRNGTFDGSRGFGWQKISQKHKINSYNAIGFTAHNPDGGVAEGSDRRYMAFANKKTCDVSHTQCTIDQSVPVKLIVGYGYEDIYHKVAVHGIVGVKTAYCVNDDRANDCPPWVDGALRGSFSQASRSATSEQVSIVWTYEPLSPVLTEH